jgi:hypothetical protein
MLKAYLIANGITDDVDLVAVWEAGIMEIERPEPKSGKRLEADPATRAERERVRAEKACLRAKKNRDRKKTMKARTMEAAVGVGLVFPDPQISEAIEVRTESPSAPAGVCIPVAMPAHPNAAVPPSP